MMAIENIPNLENSTAFGREEMFRFGSTVLFIVAALWFSSSIRTDGESVGIERVTAASWMISVVIGGVIADPFRGIAPPCCPANF